MDKDGPTTVWTPKPTTTQRKKWTMEVKTFINPPSSNQDMPKLLADCKNWALHMVIRVFQVLFKTLKIQYDHSKLSHERGATATKYRKISHSSKHNSHHPLCSSNYKWRNSRLAQARFAIRTSTAHLWSIITTQEAIQQKFILKLSAWQGNNR